MATEPCLFCDGKAHNDRCMTCARKQSVKRRICAHCKGQTPAAEQTCCHCGAAVRSEMRWKIPAIILMFALAIGISIAIQLA